VDLENSEKKKIFVKKFLIRGKNLKIKKKNKKN